MRSSPLVLLATVALLFDTAASEVDEGSVDCGAMRTKSLRQWLAARGLKCDGCAEKADFVALCEANKDAPLIEPTASAASSGGPRVRTPGEGKDADIDELLRSMKGMPGMENIKVFGADDLANMRAEDFGGGSKTPKKSSREYRAELESFYREYGLEDKLDGIDGAMAKWKGREERMMAAVRKKYHREVLAKEAGAAAQDGGDKEEL